MFVSPTSRDPVAAVTAIDGSAVRAMVDRLSGATGPVGMASKIDAERIELIRALEDLKNAAAGLQASVTEEFDASQCAQQAAAGVPTEKIGQGVGAQIALARRCSPHRGRRHLSLARVLRREMPCTHAALRAGLITEFGATLVARGTVNLSREDRMRIDAEIAADPDRIERLGERGIEAEVAKAAYRLDPVAVVERRRHAESERYVSLRPAPDTMTYLTALLPMADGVAVYAALGRAADEARSTGQPGRRGQVMADTLRDAVLSGRLAGRNADAAAGGALPGAAAVGELEALKSPAARPPDVRGLPDGVAVVLDLVLTDTQLFGRGDASEGEVLIGGPAGAFGLADADLARQIAALTPADRIWLRRLYRHPRTGELVALDSKRRRFPPGLQRLIRVRDQHCRTPWCRAPIRHSDHAHRWADDGATAIDNGQGLCEACNHAKEAPGWHTSPARIDTDAGTDTDTDTDTDRPTHRVVITTPTGHTHLTSPPSLPGHDPSRDGEPGANPRTSPRTLRSTHRGPVVEIVHPALPAA